MARPKLTAIHMFLIAIVAIASVTIAGIGFLGSYTAVRELAVEQGFGRFSTLFPIGIDVGIIALLALDLLLSWLRIPFFLLRQTAWLLTVATIAMNAASAWPHPLGVGMHAVIPLLFVVIAEAGRHAISRLAKLKDSRRMESVRFMRWILSPFRTFAMWRRMMLWEIRSVDDAVRLEQMRLAYAMLLEDEYGKDWAKTAPRATVLPLRLAKLGVPIYTTAPQGLAAAGLSDSAFGGLFTAIASPVGEAAASSHAELVRGTHGTADRQDAEGPAREPVTVADDKPEPTQSGLAVGIAAAAVEATAQDDAASVPEEEEEEEPVAASDLAQNSTGPVLSPAAPQVVQPASAETPIPDSSTTTQPAAPGIAGPEESQSREEQLYSYYRHYVDRHGQQPEKHLFADFIYREFGQTGQSGTGPVSVQSLRRYWGNLEARYQEEQGATQVLEGAAK
ncbi:DUF2637 domain-containing protein [Kitasatospora sp. NPDC085895]|uniref:DUF2637 domain-containing protein n=1 Tax=Kitasatospora sp. NPDC085895 TaxID=3155057 RepID=UPI00344F7B3D